MRAMVIAGRELRSFFQMPLGWLLVALCLLGSGFAFTSATLEPGAPATMRAFFSLWWFILALIAPAISMRLMSEEYRAGTIEPLMGAPVGELSVALGKFLGACGFLACCLLPTLVYPAALMVISKPDPGPIFAGYLGVMLAGMLYLAVGLVFSCLTASQTLAFLSTFFLLVGFEIALEAATRRWPDALGALSKHLSANARIADFASGLVDTSHIAYFVIVSAWLVVLSALILRVRRWR